MQLAKQDQFDHLTGKSLHHHPPALFILRNLRASAGSGVLAVDPGGVQLVGFAAACIPAQAAGATHC
jgi:hypothetical protein